MSDRVREYIGVKITDVSKVERFATKIIKTPQFKNILNNNLEDFRQFYLHKINTLGSQISADTAANYNLMSANMN